ncbi:hypothetical protein FSS13T_10260 [Flavobacterium saliperosum S13]|uniref:Uncharacterized protein n=1 Tax=Flavobacterium saliperosum S13 TaxID=1341155 RepID=A0ABP2ZXV8_9FLAO|nr:hypothetical protein FSS13T_10260 [Flavobacterium saliperosum S13]
MSTKIKFIVDYFIYSLSLGSGICLSGNLPHRFFKKKDNS